MALRSSWASWAFQVTVVVWITRASRWAGLCGQLGGVVAPAAWYCRAPGSPPAPGVASSAARSLAGFSGRTTPDRRSPDRGDVGHYPPRQLRRRHVLAAESPSTRHDS